MGEDVKDLFPEGVRNIVGFRASGLDCVVVEHERPSLHWYCGYVRMPEEATVTYEDCEVRVNGQSVEDHAPGGITYRCNRLPYTEDPGQWIGFDTEHAFMEDATAEDARSWTVELAFAVAVAAMRK